MNRKKTMGDLISPKTDIVFKELMRDETVRRHFLSDVLDIPLDRIESVRLEDTFLSRRLRMWHEMRSKEQRDRWVIEDALKEDAYAEGHPKGCEDGRKIGIQGRLSPGHPGTSGGVRRHPRRYLCPHFCRDGPGGTAQMAQSGGPCKGCQRVQGADAALIDMSAITRQIA